MKNTSFESIVVSWLMQDGWQVFIPILDHGHQTDLLISDGPNYYRIQVKTVDACGDNHVVQNRWEGSNIDVVIFFARNSNWGVIAPAFAEPERPLNHSEHRKFNQTKKEFLREFHQL
ncbi:PDDEXK-like family protein [Halothiobacillus diazotrophicus]|uniref:group I intron-associated PD-(D/E)XK endonuclease n=1 Tax=Halothiobacillus diazotrophicus TaxID=1860122 RepID=UPI0018D46934|nr:group I intron-associated PD-(D/E)XK endonuclease [Halothiobacillus diazotrophicus]